MTILILYVLVTAAWWYLGAAARITYPIRTRLPDWLQGYLGCAACSGFLYGAGVAAIGEAFGVVLFGLAPYVVIPAIAFASIAATPLVASALLRSLSLLDAALHGAEDHQQG